MVSNGNFCSILITVWIRVSQRRANFFLSSSSAILKRPASMCLQSPSLMKSRTKRCSKSRKGWWALELTQAIWSGVRGWITPTLIWRNRIPQSPGTHGWHSNWETHCLHGVLHLMILRGVNGMRRPWRSSRDLGTKRGRVVKRVIQREEKAPEKILRQNKQWWVDQTEICTLNVSATDSFFWHEHSHIFRHRHLHTPKVHLGSSRYTFHDSFLFSYLDTFLLSHTYTDSYDSFVVIQLVTRDSTPLFSVYYPWPSVANRPLAPQQLNSSLWKYLGTCKLLLEVWICFF